MEKDIDYKKRVEYTWKCKHYADGVCLKRSGCSGGWHIVSCCDEDCERMRNYDKKKGAANE